MFTGGEPISLNIKVLKDPKLAPHIVIGTPGRILALAKRGFLRLDRLKVFVLDECDKMIAQIDMRRDVQEIFRKTPHQK